MSELFSPEALAAQIKTLPDLPTEEGGIGVVAKDGDVGVEAEVNKQLGKGWFVEGSGAWMKKAGYSVAGWIGWKGK